MRIYDVVIVGAGPGGLNCARILAKSDKSVLVLEQNETIGPKVCAGGISMKDMDYLDIPRNLTDNGFNQIIVNTPFGRHGVKTRDNIVYTIDRHRLGQWQLNKLKGSNIEIKTGSRVTGIRKGVLEVNNSERVGFEHLVGSDGSLSVVRKYLGLETREMAVAIQYLVPGKSRTFEFFFEPRMFHSWLGWIFPHRDHFSVGCGCDPRYMPVKKLRKNFEEWLKRMDIDVSSGIFEAFSINSDYQGFSFGNAFLVGDAAGLASNVTGKGIYPALISGEEVGRLIIDENHIPVKMSELLRIKKKHQRFLNFMKNSGPLRMFGYDVLALFSSLGLVDKEDFL